MKFSLVLVVVAAIALIVLVALKKQPGGGSKRSRRRVGQAAPSEPQSSFRATRIVPGTNACQAARELKGKLFLDKELNTPRLPLPGCTQVSDCRCRYEHQDDRRTDENDRRIHTLETELYPAAEGEERRHKKQGRRSTD